GGTRGGATSTLVVSPGADLAVDLVWRGLVAMSVRYKTSVQIIGPQGTPVAQHDSEPAGWTRPTTSWLPGEVIVDRHVLTVPPDLAPGAYGLAVVVYDAASGERLALAGGPAAPMDALVLAGLEVASGP
ncbi:MAG: hypothetical protein ACE5EL_01260, partial [Anaerolineae bacterium]